MYIFSKNRFIDNNSNTCQLLLNIDEDREKVCFSIIGNNLTFNHHVMMGKPFLIQFPHSDGVLFYCLHKSPKGTPLAIFFDSAIHSSVLLTYVQEIYWKYRG